MCLAAPMATAAVLLRAAPQMLSSLLVYDAAKRCLKQQVCFADLVVQGFGVEAPYIQSSIHHDKSHPRIAFAGCNASGLGCSAAKLFWPLTVMCGSRAAS